MSALFSLDTLLNPIAEHNLIGVDPRLQDPEKTYQQIKDARMAARRMEREAVFSAETKPAIDEKWRTVEELAIKLLGEQAKDLEVVAWLIEALLRLKGFSGLADGFQLMRCLLEKYWPEIYPQEDEEGLSSKLLMLTGLNGASSPGTLIDPIYQAPLTAMPTAFNTWHYQQALQTDKDIAEPQEDLVSLQTLQDAARQSSAVFMQQLKNDVERCLNEYKLLCALTDQLCGTENSPPCSNIRQALEACQTALQYLVKDMLPVASIDSPTGAIESTLSSTDQQSSSINSRQQAFNQLLELAKYFRQREPNSPVSYLLEQAVRWGNMPLPQLLAELIYDRQVLEQSYQLIGVKPLAGD